MKYRELKWTDTSEAHIARHGVGPDEVEEVLAGPPLILKKGRDGTLLAYGQTFSGRYLMVVLAPAEDGRDFVVTARGMTSNEEKVFRRKC